MFPTVFLVRFSDFTEASLSKRAHKHKLTVYATEHPHRHKLFRVLRVIRVIRDSDKYTTPNDKLTALLNRNPFVVGRFIARSSAGSPPFQDAHSPFTGVSRARSKRDAHASVPSSNVNASRAPSTCATPLPAFLRGPAYRPAPSVIVAVGFRGLRGNPIANNPYPWIWAGVS